MKRKETENSGLRSVRVGGDDRDLGLIVEAEGSVDRGRESRLGNGEYW